MPRLRLSILATLFIAGLSAFAPNTRFYAQARKHLLIVIDGLRPDYVTDAVMPTLSALGKRGVVFANHHSVFPTVTRVNASSISTGAYPERHGLMGNTVFFPSVDKTKFLDTSVRNDLLRVERTEKQLLTATTLGETLQATGQRMLVVSSGSSGSAYLNNHRVAGGAILHYEFVLPESLRPEMAKLGNAPREDSPPAVKDGYAVDAFLQVGLPQISPAVTVMWLGSLDDTAHANGVGAPQTIAALRALDGQIKRVEDGLRQANVFDSYDIWVTSDHGFSTHTGGADLNAILAPFNGTLPDGSPRLVASGGAIYVRDNDDRAIAGIVAALQRDPKIGAIFTRPESANSMQGHFPGTLSFNVSRSNHPRGPQILYSPTWTDDTNTFGMPGTVASGGVAGHGSASPRDVHNTLIAAGPDLKSGVTISAPSANVDLASTFLGLLNVRPPATMQGRSLDEALIARSAPAPDARASEETAATADGRYRVTASITTVRANGREYRYFDKAVAARN